MTDFGYLNDKKPSLFRRILKETIIWIVEIALVIFAAYLVIAYGVEKTEVAGVSMSTTLEEGAKILINKLSYRFGEPSRFDVIVFDTGGKERNYYNVRRVIGLPGETVEIKEGKVYIDGDVLEEPIIVDDMVNSGLAGESIVLNEDEYFVLGDNRNNSEDSRFANIGNITSDMIVGKAWVRLNPFSFVKYINTKQEDE